MHHRCHWHRWQMKKKSSIRKIYIISFGHLWVVELVYRYICFFKFILSCQQFDNCSHCLPPVSFTTGANLPLVSLIPVASCDRHHWHRWQICHRYQKHSWNWWKSLLPVSLIPVVHLDLRISPRIFEKIWNSPNGILWGWGKLIHEKNQKQKSRDTVPLS